MARAVSSNETASGWQQALFSAPVSIAANTTYVASYHTTSGFFSFTSSFFTSQVDSPPLHALSDAAAGGNGTYAYSSTPVFPSNSYQSSNYFVDVVFAASGSGSSGSGSSLANTSLWNNSGTPAVINQPGSSPVELGMKFQSDVSGLITGIRFYKGSQNTGTHTVSLYTFSGTLLARAVSGSEGPSGWQQVNFASPVSISAGAIYVASYHTTSGFFSFTPSYFTSQFDSSPLHALSNNVSGGNGVYTYSSVPSFPNNTYQASNYWVDVVFQGP
jgi:hypothetical protein